MESIALLREGSRNQIGVGCKETRLEIHNFKLELNWEIWSLVENPPIPVSASVLPRKAQE
jgi:hypothetical protein